MKVSMCKNFIPATCKMLLLIIFGFNTSCINAQQNKIDSLKQLLSVTKKDTIKIILLDQLAQSYRDEKKIDSSILTYKQALELNQKIKYSLLKQCYTMATIDYLLYVTGNYTESLKYASLTLQLSEKINDTIQKAFSHLVFGHDYKGLGEYRQSLNHYFKARQIFKLYYESKNEPEDNTYTILCIGEVYLKMNQPDSALIFTQQAYRLALADPTWGPGRQGRSAATNYVLYSMRILGDISFMKGYDQTALNYYRQYISGFEKYKENNRDLGFVFISIARIFQKKCSN